MRVLNWNNIIASNQFSMRRIIEFQFNNEITRALIKSIEKIENNIVIKISHIRHLNLITGKWHKPCADDFEISIEGDDKMNPYLSKDGRIIFKVLAVNNYPDSYDKENEKEYKKSWQFAAILTTNLDFLNEINVDKQLFQFN